MQYFLLSSLLFLSTIGAAQKDTGQYLTWNAKKKLTWSDYKARPDATSDAAASTTTVLSIEYNISQNNFGYKIESKFSKSRSWGRHKTDYILSHEQGHFDIAEIHARILHKRMSEYKFNKRTYQKDLKKIYEEVSEDKSEMQEDYDAETRHSINREKQAEWLKKIEKLLEEYSDYADY